MGFSAGDGTESKLMFNSTYKGSKIKELSTSGTSETIVDPRFHIHAGSGARTVPYWNNTLILK